MATTSTLQVVGNVIAGQPFTMILTVTNNAGSDVTITGINPYALPNTVPCYFKPPAFPPGATSTVTASGGTLTVGLTGVIYSPQTPGTGMAGSSCQVTVDVVTSDGAVSSAVPQWISVASGAPSPSQGYGQFRFDDGLNLVNLPIL
jgi:hypothetical protein